MIPFGFYALSGAWLFLLIAPLVLFYFLKLRRTRQQVPSLVLWRQVLRDRRVNSPFQRFKRNILLLLQLLLLILLILAAMQPFWRGEATRRHRLPILIDCSASMAALDRPGGVSRLEAAKQRVRKLVDGLLPDQELCLISFGNTARKRTGFINNKRVLHEALDKIEVEDVRSDIEDALRMAQALARNVAFDEVLLLSDGNFPERANFELCFDVNYQKLPRAGPNLGITSLNARRPGRENWDVFVNVEGSAGTGTAAVLEVLQDGRPLASENVSLGKNRSERMLFRVPGERPSAIEVRLIPDDFDSLDSDNVAFLDLPAVRSLWVYCPRSLAAYRHALSPLKGIRVFPEQGAGATESDYDLVISDRPDDLHLSARTYLCVGIVPSDVQTLLAVEEEGAVVVDWRRDSPLLQHVSLNDIVLLDNPVARTGARENDYENIGYEVLVYGQQGPLVLEKRSDEKLAFYMLFHSDRSTLPYRVGFPIMVSNLVRMAMGQAGLADAQACRAGVLPAVKLTPNKGCHITGPDGKTRQESTDKKGVLSGIPANRTGYYEISQAGRAVARVGVSLIDPAETALAGTEEILFKEQLSVVAAAATLKTDRALWSHLALLALAVLLVEWWYFQRRPGGYWR